MNELFMRKAIRIASESVMNGGGPFGAVIVKDGEIIAESANSVTQDNDSTAHAEINAIRQACFKLGTFDLTGATYTPHANPVQCVLARYIGHALAIYIMAIAGKMLPISILLTITFTKK